MCRAAAADGCKAIIQIRIGAARFHRRTRRAGHRANIFPTRPMPACRSPKRQDHDTEATCSRPAIGRRRVRRRHPPMSANGLGPTLREQAAAEKAKAAEGSCGAANAKATADWQPSTSRVPAQSVAPNSTQPTGAANRARGHRRQSARNSQRRTWAALNIDRTRAAHDSCWKARKNALYDEAGNINARISDGANHVVSMATSSAPWSSWHPYTGVLTAIRDPAAMLD